jgi:putative membrane protein
MAPKRGVILTWLSNDDDLPTGFCYNPNLCLAPFTLDTSDSLKYVYPFCKGVFMSTSSVKPAPATASLLRSVRKPKDYFVIALKGMCMGASDIVPGVSGGTMAFIMGIYEELIDSIRTVGQRDFIQAVLRFRIQDVLQILNWPFLLALGSGILLAIFTLAHSLEWLLENEPVYLWSFFFGLVLASIISVSKRVKKWTPSLGALMLAGAVGAYILVGLVPSQTPNDWWFLILSGAVAICAMILPGISGAFILVLLGKYQFVLSAVNGFRQTFNLQDLLTIVLVGIGAVVGLISFAQVLGWLFRRYHDGTVAVLIGLMVGSLRKVWPWKFDADWLRDSAGEFVLSDGHRIVTEQHNILPNGGAGELILAIVIALAGVLLVLMLERLANQK